MGNDVSKEIYSREQDLKILMEIKNGDLYQQKFDFAQNFPIEEFKGNFPIRTLVINLATKYNSLSDSAISELRRLTIDECSLDLKIKYNIMEERIFSPQILTNNGIYKMSFGETFVAYTWCVTYFFLIKYEKLISDARGGSPKDELSITPRMLDRAWKLFNWSQGLRDNARCQWPEGYPNPSPTSEQIDSEALYSLKVNDLAVKIVCFCLYHELGHAILKHKNSDIENEKEADNFAFDCMLHSEEKQLKGNELAMIIGTGELLFLCHDSKDIHQKTHPDIHIRMSNAMQKIRDFQGTEFSNELGCMQSIIYTEFLDAFNIPYDKETHFDSFDECNRYFESMLDDV